LRPKADFERESATPADLPIRIEPSGAYPGFARLRSDRSRVHASRSKLRPKADFEREERIAEEIRDEPRLTGRD